jgi:hypothetical protein
MTMIFKNKKGDEKSSPYISFPLQGVRGLYM